jgi:hypothetical protein
MRLFGPLDSLMYGDAPPVLSPEFYPYGSDATGYTMPSRVPRPVRIPNPYVLPSYPPAAAMTSGTPGASPVTAPGQAPAPPLPSLQTLGTFTTRRTQLFGPLGSVSI